MKDFLYAVSGITELFGVALAALELVRARARAEAYLKDVPPVAASAHGRLHLGDPVHTVATQDQLEREVDRATAQLGAQIGAQREIDRQHRSRLEKTLGLQSRLPVVGTAGVASLTIGIVVGWIANVY
jgi:hypothetical protein